MPEAIWISFAFVIGLLVKAIGLPPLIGYLAAGFALSGLASTTDITAEPTSVLAHIAHLGVLLLLFTVGLKLKLKSIVSPEVIGGSLLHFGITCVVFAPGLYLLFDLDWTTALMLAIALSFSSTVLAAKVLESKRELRAFHGRVAIGILIMQDLIALVVMSLAAGKTPSEWALIVFGLPLLRPLLYRLLDASGHDELLVLLGLLLALVVGGRSSFLTSLSLTNYSEFGLIVASIALPEWLVPLAISVSLSFVISAQIREAGANQDYLTMSETGGALASHLLDDMRTKESESQPQAPSDV